MPAISRRQFAGALGAGVSALALPVRSLAAPPPTARGPRFAGPVRLDSNENPYGPSPRARDAMTQSEAVASRYPDSAEDAVAAALAAAHGVAAEQVVLGCGSGEVLKMADGAFLAPGRTLVVAEPTFEAVLGYAQVTQAEPVKVPLTGDHRHDLPAMAAACDARTGLVYVCNPNNPTGTIVTGGELGAFLERVPATATVLVDEAYHHFVEDASYRSAFEHLARHPNLVVVRTFSKIYGLAGMRLGYAVATPANAAALRSQKIWSNANAGVLAAVLASLEDAAHVADQRQRLNGSKRWLYAELSKDGRRAIPSEANFVMIHLGTDVAPVIEGFKARGIGVGRRFAALPEWLRISIGTPEEMQAFMAGLRELVPVRAAA